MPGTFHTLFKEPCAPGARGPRTADWLFVAIVLLVALAEGSLKPPEIWPVLSIALTAALGFTLPWRRVYPLSMVVLAFSATGTVHLASAVLGVSWDGLSTGVFLLVLPYALLRWGAGREAVVGLLVIALSFASAMWNGDHSLGEVIGASLFMLFPAALGASVRYQDSAARRAHEQVRSREREQLARELHDTVAHYVSAIAVQAQAGRALAATQPGAPGEALAVIEEAASRTLAEMRRIVGALRAEGEAPALVPAARIEDLPKLGRRSQVVAVKVMLEGAFDDLDASVHASVYRLAQESITNALRHATGATEIRVSVTAGPTEVRVRVVDDGAPVTRQTSTGFGLRGMAERASLLGGSLKAGPGQTRGWVVEAAIPCEGGDR